MKKYLLLTTALILMSGDAWAEEELPTSGGCGTGCAWVYDATTNTLKITGDGTGVMDNYDYGGWTGKEKRPEWYGYKNVAQNIVVEGVTNIGQCAFMSFENVTSLEMDDSVTKMESDEFSGMYSLENLKLSENLIWLGGQALQGTGQIDNIVLPDSLKNFSGNLFGLHVNTLIIPSELAVKDTLFTNGLDIRRGTSRINHMYCTGKQMQNCSAALQDAGVDIEPTRYEKTKDGVVVYDDKGHIVGKYKNTQAIGDGKIDAIYKYSDSGHFIGTFDAKGNRIGKKIYTVEEAMEATKNGDKFHVYVTYK